VLWSVAIVVFVALAIAINRGGLAGSRWLEGWETRLGLIKSQTTLLVSGNIEAHQSVLSFKTVQSRIVALPFDEGQWVKAGSTIARVDDADYRQQVATAAKKTVDSDAADLSMKVLDFERYQSLWQRGYAPTQQRDQASTAVRQGQATLERDQALQAVADRNIALAQANVHSAEQLLVMAKIVLGYTTLSAPFDGVVLVRQAEIGETETAATPVATLADLDHVWLRAYINETDIAQVRLGTKVAVTTDTYPGKVYQGRISFISSSAEFTPKTVETHAERVTLVYRIKIDIDNPSHELVPGMPADATIGLPSP
jgi:HlyD family secretion protein